MSVCEGFEKCTFFSEHMSSLPSTAALTQSNFCKKNYQDCARYRIFELLGEAHVPSDLAPNEKDRADSIIADARG